MNIFYYEAKQSCVELHLSVQVLLYLLIGHKGDSTHTHFMKPL